MATNSSASNHEKHQSGLSNMTKPSQTPLAQLRPNILDDDGIQKGINLIEQVCGNIDQNVIAVVFHECEYDLRNTIARLKSGVVVEDGGWKPAKASNKKKMNQHSNANIRTASPPPTTTTTTRYNYSNYRRHEYPHQNSSYSRGGYSNRRGHNNTTMPSNVRYNSRQVPQAKQTTTRPPVVSNLAANEQRSPSSTSNDEFEFLVGATRSLTFDNSSKKSDVPTGKHRPASSSIPRKPVSMHPSVQFSANALDIQFGDVQWNDSIPVVVTPTDDMKNNESMSKVDDKPANIDENPSKDELIQTSPEINPTTSASTADDVSVLLNTLNETNETSQVTTSNNLPSSSNSTTPVPVAINVNPVDYHSPINHQNNNLQSQANLNSYPSAFTPYHATHTSYPTSQRGYPSTKISWGAASTQPTNTYKTMPTSNLSLGTAYGQSAASYPLTNQQPYLLSAYAYQQGLIPIIPSVDSWSTATYPSTFENYPTYTNYFPPYLTAQQYHQHPITTTKYNQYPNYDRETNATYGLARSSTNDSTTNASQSNKDLSSTSTLSTTTASFSQGAPLTTTNPVGTVIINPVNYSMPAYMSYPPIDSRDNRIGAPYGSQNDRTSYQQQQQQRYRYPH